jgi:hypothetical protein
MIKIITYKIKYFFILLTVNQLLLSYMVQIYTLFLFSESAACLPLDEGLRESLGNEQGGATNSSW